jgi:hypothetical protein
LRMGKRRYRNQGNDSEIVKQLEILHSFSPEV